MAQKKQHTGRIKQTAAKKKVTKDILIGELVEKYPESVPVLTTYGFHCIGCMVSPYETLEQGSAVHGIPLQPLLDDINTAIQK